MHKTIASNQSVFIVSGLFSLQLHSQTRDTASISNQTWMYTQMLLDFSSKFSAIFDCNGLWLPLYYCELVIFSFWFVSVFFVCFLWCVWWIFFEIMFVFGFYQKKIDGHLDKHVVIYGIVWTFTFQQHPYCTCAAFQSIGKSFIKTHTQFVTICALCVHCSAHINQLGNLFLVNYWPHSAWNFYDQIEQSK